MTEEVVALDIGGTKLAAALVSPTGEISRHLQRATGTAAAGDGEALWDRVVGLLDDVVDGATPVAVGAGCGGPMQWPVGEVSPVNIPAWRGFPLRARLAERFPSATVRLHNDAVTMAIGEHWRGSGRAATAFLGVVVSTGVGGGLIVAGRVVDGETGNAGHVGHVVVEPDGPRCHCGGRGCLEAVARGPAVVRWAVDRGWQPPGGAVADGRSLVAAARAGDEVALAALRRAGNALGIALASCAHLLELDVVAVAGGLAVGAGDLVLGPAREAFSRHARMDFAARCRIVPAELGAAAGLLGAAALVGHGDRYWSAGAD
jgi:glucokinase